MAYPLHIQSTISPPARKPRWISLFSSFEPKLFSDQFAKAVSDFRVARNWRFPPFLGIHVYVVLFAMTLQVAPCLCQLLDESTPFHTSTPSSFV